MKMRKWISSSLVVFLIMLWCLIGCAAASQDDWGSFSPDKTYSYDGAYYALQQAEEIEGVRWIRVEIYAAEDDSLCFSFTPARARDFWGICWERDSYSIWVQSGDIGTLCYRYENGCWEPDEQAVKPDYIVTKYEQKTTKD